MSSKGSKTDRARRLVSEGAQLLASRRPDEAIEKLSEAHELDPHNVATAINLGGAYIMTGKHNKAVPVLEAAARLEPENVMVWTNLAAAYLGKLPFSTSERQDKAIEAYKRALSIDPRTPHVHYNLGLIYLERNDKQHAAEQFYQALETDPSDQDAQRYLARLREQHDHSDQESQAH